MEIIQSKQNASIKSARKLLQRKHRKTSYLLEGWHLFEEAKASGADILQVFVLEEMADRVANMAKVKLVSPEVLKELCETQTPQGLWQKLLNNLKPCQNLSQEVSSLGGCSGSWQCRNNDSHSGCRRL